MWHIPPHHHFPLTHHQSLHCLWYCHIPPEEEEEEEDEGVLSPAELGSVWLVVGGRSAAFCMCVCVKAHVVLQNSEFH